MIVRVFRAALLPASARRPAAIRKVCLAALRRERCRKTGELNVVFLERTAMRKMNSEFLNHRHDTDVIAFRYDGAPGGGDQPFGDVYISAYQARRQAKELGHPVLDEVLTLVVHGTLHLLGYDDHAPAARRLMFERQEQILHGRA